LRVILILTLFVIWILVEVFEPHVIEWEKRKIEEKNAKKNYCDEQGREHLVTNDYIPGFEEFNA